MKSRYQFLLTNLHNANLGPSSSDTMKPQWRAIWQLQVPSKDKNLVWRACKNSLPSKKSLVKCRVITNDKCNQCKTMTEDIHHALYLCLMLTKLWQSIPLWNHHSLKQCSNFIDLLECIFADNRDPTLFSMVAWTLWNRRNNLCLAKGMVSLGKLLQHAKDRIQEFSKGQPAPILHWGHPRESWQPATPQWYKVNFNGALFEKEHCARIGDVIQNDKGLVMASLSQ